MVGKILLCKLSEIPELSESFDQKIYSNVLDINIRPEKWANKNSCLSDMYVQNLVIDVQDSEPKKEKEKVAKEQPIWMSQSTVEEASSAVDTSAEIPKTDENVKESIADNEVIKTLLIHESKSSSGTRQVPPLAQSKCHESESDTSESEEDTKHVKPGKGKVVGSDLEQEEQETVDPTVMVAGQPHLYSEVSENPELVSFMTGEEREAYIKVGQEMFQSVFE
ncbi:general transcription factor IIE subunit 1-like [Alligator mississippiensis]|uniref:General transcription factor IIE subunit 1-like n=1 Tax=Alligator mississippiensis TaxID=8496 RepID=A0A151PAK0_ALLMI|nr:general transcription factor IIE subunit 1-like [Alligator mississippiensis]